MNHLLQIEQDFLMSSVVTSEINFATIFTAQANADNAQKAKFDKSIKLAEMVAKASAWYDKSETKAQLESNGIEWDNKETFFQRVFGWQKSFAYKMVKAGNIKIDQGEVVTAFKRHCTAQENAGEGSNRSIAGLLKFAKGDTETASRPKALATFSIAKDGLNGEKGFSIRINNDGSIDANGEIIDSNIDYNVVKLFSKLQRIANS
jgi:hypothetical protein